MKKIALAIALLLLGAGAARAHKPSDSYVTLRAEGARLEGRWDIALRDLDHAIGIDGDADGAITWGELRLRRGAIAAYALTRLRIEADGDECATRAGDLLVDHHSDGAYAVLRFSAACAQPIAALDLRYGLLFDVDPQHRGLVQVAGAGGERTLLFTAERPRQSLDLVATGRWQLLRDFWRDGVWHIWIGFDHILFLLTLLMPAVLRREHGRWRVVSGFGEAFASTLKIVTAFTVAHSITLTLAALGLVHLPSRLVEAGIAASVIVAALNNAHPLFGDQRWLVAFGFGLLHGFGFASVLADPGLPRPSLVLALLGFNLGVESGQLAIVALFLPLAYALRSSWFYQRVTLVAGSSMIALLAAAWFVERAFDLRLIG